MSNTQNIDLEALEQERQAVKRQEDTNKYFTTFKNIKGQLKKELAVLYQRHYDEGYTAVMEDPENANLSEIKRQEKAEEFAKKYAKSKMPSDHLAIGDFLRQYIHFVRVKPYGHNQKAPLYFYIPDHGVYVENDEQLNDLISVIYRKATEGLAKNAKYTIARNVPMKNIDENCVVIGDRVFDSRTESFMEFSPDLIVTRRTSIKYNPDCKEPNIQGWTPSGQLEESFNGDKELVTMALQIIKAVITGKSQGKIYWLQGQGGTGKGTFQEIISNIVGDKYIAPLKINELDGKDKFSTSALLGKSVVIGDDIQKGVKIKDTSILFSIAGGDVLRIEEKGKTPYSLHIKIPVIQSSNGFPNMNADIDAINRRFVVLPFTKSFKGKFNPKIKAEYLKRRDVLEYYVKLAMETPWSDHVPRSALDLLAENQKEINPILGFTEEFFTDQLASDFLPNDFVWGVWLDFLDFNNRNSNLTSQGFHKEVKTVLPKLFVAGTQTIQAGWEMPKGFYPHEDLPSYAKHRWSSGRQTPERRKKKTTVRGYKKQKR